MKKKIDLMISGVVCGVITLLGLISLARLILPYFSVSTEKAGEIGVEYWQSHYFDGSFGRSLIGLFFACLLSAIASGLCFHYAKKQNDITTDHAPK